MVNRTGCGREDLPVVQTSSSHALGLHLIADRLDAGHLAQLCECGQIKVADAYLPAQARSGQHYGHTLSVSSAWLAETVCSHMHLPQQHVHSAAAMAGCCSRELPGPYGRH